MFENYVTYGASTVDERSTPITTMGHKAKEIIIYFALLTITLIVYMK